MNRADFLQALEAGLAAASPDERAAALQYYSEYLDEAGPENEADALAKLGSPEKVAADVLGTSQPSGNEMPPPVGGWTPPAAPRAPEPPPEWRQGAEHFNQTPAPPQYPYGAVNPYGQPQKYPQQRYNQQNNSIAKIILLVFAVIVLFPLLGGLTGAAFGILIAALTVLCIPIIVGIALLGSGIAVIVCGGYILLPFLASGLLTLGIGIALAGAGLLCIYGGVIILSKLVPAVFRTGGHVIGSAWNSLTSLFSKRTGGTHG